MDDGSTRRIPDAALALGLAGALPFVGAAAVIWLGREPEHIRWALVAVLVYGAVILSFLGGIRWGTAMGPYSPRRTAAEFTLSIFPALAAWLALLIPPVPALALLIAAFLLQVLWDVTSVQTGRLPAWFGRLRIGLTAVVVLCLLLILGRLIMTSPP